MKEETGGRGDEEEEKRRVRKMKQGDRVRGERI